MRFCWRCQTSALREQRRVPADVPISHCGLPRAGCRVRELTTVAEGVETRDQLDFMRRMGCDQSQGYLHSHPLPNNEFALLLEHGRGNLVWPPEASADSVPKDSQGRR
jgi:predicted signal transduction protein with EAL and GGDEF domain